jgi:membrane dipeptidase
MEYTYKANLTPEQEERVQTLHKESFVFDALTTSIIDTEYAKKLQSVGINATNYTVASTSLFNGQVIQDNFISTCKKIGNWTHILEKCHEFAALATNLEEMHKIVDSGKIAIFFGFQNGSPIEDNLDYLDIFYRLGVRFIQLTYNARNYIGNGCGEEKDSGLSSFGEKAVHKMNELGIVVDLSHCGYQTTMDAIECSKKPALITHANVKVLADTPRNKTDEQIRFMADRGGVIGVKHMLGDTKTKLAQDTLLLQI